MKTAALVALTLLFSPVVRADPTVTAIGTDLYAYISDNDGSANSTFLVGHKGILVVDTGLDATEGGKLLQAIRKVSSLPVQFVVNTHYHPDHQGGNATVGPAATVISTEYTRNRTVALRSSTPALSALMPADITFTQALTVHLDPYTVQIWFPGKAHTSGDALVYFPQHKAMAMGDLFLNRSSPAIDGGSVSNWLAALDEVLKKPLVAAVPGHFELGTKADVERFRNYLQDLYAQVEMLKKSGASVEQMKTRLNMEKYKDFRQYPKYQATFADNAEFIYRELGP
jgi:glyoxylase-like metal-dependent hydrolase (beta-lactamase superfamily II)